MVSNFAGDNHALKTGMALGMLLKHGITAYPEVDDDGNYTSVIFMEFVFDEEEIVVRMKVEP